MITIRSVIFFVAGCLVASCFAEDSPYPYYLERADKNYIGEAIIHVGKNIYVGEVKNGLPNGTGTMFMAHGDALTGNWVDGEQVGKGAFITNTHKPEITAGNMKGNKVSGVGIASDSSHVFIGPFKQGLPSGEGKCVSKNGEEICTYKHGQLEVEPN